MRLDHFLLGVIIFSVIIVGGVFLMGDMNKNYNLTMSTSEFNSTYNTIDEMYNITQNMKNHTLDGDVSESDSWDVMTKGAYSGARLVKNTFSLVGAIINDLAKAIGVPPFFIVFAITALTIAIIFAIIYLVMRFKP